MSEKESVAGWATTFDGDRVPMSPESADALWRAIEVADERRRAAMPDSISALHTMDDAHTRLRDEGWSDAIYCPKDGSEFAVIQFGSTGIFPAFYQGEWPSGYLMVGDYAGRPQGHLWKPIDRLTDAERAVLNECIDAERRMFDAHLKTMARLTEIADEGDQ